LEIVPAFAPHIVAGAGAICSAATLGGNAVCDGVTLTATAVNVGTSSFLVVTGNEEPRDFLIDAGLATITEGSGGLMAGGRGMVAEGQEARSAAGALRAEAGDLSGFRHPIQKGRLLLRASGQDFRAWRFTATGESMRTLGMIGDGAAGGYGLAGGGLQAYADFGC
jgi:hypothetical protein